MQVVKWGKKQRVVKVPVGWAFVNPNVAIKAKDKFFDDTTHCWNNVEIDMIGKFCGRESDFVFIRERAKADGGQVDCNPRSERIIE